MRETIYTITDVGDGLWAIETPFVRSYLLVGSSAALLIDTGMGDFSWQEAISRITLLPVTVVNTHGHEDHCRGDDQFQTVYAASEEFDHIYSFVDKDIVELRPLRDGDVFDLGGWVVEAVFTPGHTRGSMSFLDRTHRRLFTGDLVNSDAVVMAVDGDGYLTQSYRDTMYHLIDMAEAFDGVYSDHNAYPLPNDWLTRLARCADGVLDGSIQAQPYSFSPSEGIPPLVGQVYRQDGVSMLYIQEFPDIEA